MSFAARSFLALSMLLALGCSGRPVELTSSSYEEDHHALVGAAVAQWNGVSAEITGRDAFDYLGAGGPAAGQASITFLERTESSAFRGNKCSQHAGAEYDGCANITTQDVWVFTDHIGREDRPAIRRALLYRTTLHELGHLLGLGHVNGSTSIMYRHNDADCSEDGSECVEPELSAEDVAEFTRVFGP